MDANPVVAPPRLTRWQSTWRYLAAGGIGLGFWISTVVTQYGGAVGSEMVIDLLVGAVSVGLTHWRRRFPWAVTMTVVVLGALATSGSGAVILTMVSLATRRRWREIVPVAVVSVTASLAFFAMRPDSGWTPVASLLFAVVFASAVIATGMYIGARRDLVANLRERADRAEREQSLRVGQAQVTERARIAREMHDVLAHRLSLVALNAGALEYCRTLSESEVVEAAAITRLNAHRALEDLNDILGVLRADTADTSPEPPQPTLVDLPALVEEALGAGTKVRLHSRVGDLADTPDTIGRSAYRMIQETLTNARKHAPDTTVDITLSGRPGGQLILEVRNPIRLGVPPSGTPGSGLGLLGLTERAELIGGRLEHVKSEQEFVVRAWLPWPA